MRFLELVNKRQSVRAYSNDPVETDKIEKCIEAARLAPSACNSQPWKFIVINKPDLLKKVAEATFNSIIRFNKFSLQAQSLVIITLEKPKIITQVGGLIKNKNYPLIDLGIAAEHFCLQATELGLGTCIMGWFNQENIKEILSIPKNKEIGLIISVGYAPKNYVLRKKSRKDKKTILSYNKY
jgi:nitroreductase